MLIRAPYTLPFVFMVCYWFKYNIAVPLASHPPLAGQAHDVFREEKVNLQDKRSNGVILEFRTKRDARSSGAAIADEYDAVTSSNVKDYESLENKIKINNQNVNVNENVNILGRHRSERRKKLRESIAPVTHKLENIQKDQSINCTSGKKENQRYSSSFVGNTTGDELSVDKEFEEVIGNNSKAKKTSSVHMGEDITLCWIETTTIKENKTVRPPKRLVIREYTISFENSATIPDRYLECNRLEGELTANDSEIGRTTLFEVIDENTKVSGVVNFTSVSHIGDVIVWQHKRVKCGVGPVISKDIIEWQDGTKNPKKRVEIKVSPKMQRLTATKTEEEPCTEEIGESRTEGYESTSSSIESCENAESGSCDELTMESDRSSTKHPEVSASEEIVTELSSSGTSEEEIEEQSEEQEDLSLSADVVKSSTSSYEELFAESSTAVASAETDESISSKNVEDCEENSLDPICVNRRTTLSSNESSIGLSIAGETTARSEEASSTTLMSARTTLKGPITIGSVDVTTEETVSSEEKLPVTTESSKLSEKGVSSTVSGLTTEETTPFASEIDISMESSESQGASREGVTPVPEDISYTDYDVVTMLGTKGTTVTDIEEDESSGSTEKISTVITTAKASMETHGPTSEEGGSDDSYITEEQTEDHGTMIPIESTSKESGEVDHVPSSDVSTTVSGKATIIYEVTTAVPPFGFTEFTRKETEESGKILDKLSGPSSVSTESTPPMSEKIPSESEETVVLASGSTTIGLEFTGTKESTPLTSTSLPRIEPTVLPSTTSSDYLCENSENCAYVGGSEFCDEFGNCGGTTEFCESGECSEEEAKDRTGDGATTTETQASVTEWQSPGTQIAIEIQHTTATSITTTTLVSRESENSSTAINNVPTTVETRRSTPLLSMTTTTPRHKLTLKVKVLLEHVNEKREKQNLFEVERHLPLNENPEESEHSDLLERLKSLNNSINVETIGALLNCTSLSKLARKANFIGKLQEDVANSNNEGLEFTYPEDAITQQDNAEHVHAKYEDSDYLESDERLVYRKRRSLDTGDKMANLSGVETVGQNLSDPDVSSTSDFNVSSAHQNVNITNESTQASTTTSDLEGSASSTIYAENDGNTTEGRDESEVTSTMEGINNETRMEIVRQTLPGIQEDVSVGLQHVVSQLTRGNLSSVDETATDLLGIIADPRDDRIRSRGRRAITKEVGRWSNERIRKTSMGGKLRSFTEFTLYRILP